ncbi:hypothetical protein [Paracoccus sp. ME4]|uniref:hypothetical protein n=1 Tax=Paracoccus sp. ME4 TaxID=3138066 RepID=UPI00398B3BCD
MALNPDAPSISLGDVIFEQVGQPPEAVLSGHIRIGGLDMHLTAIQVNQNDDAVDGDYQDDLDIPSSSGSMRTLEIEGKNYVLLATPFDR